MSETQNRKKFYIFLDRKYNQQFLLKDDTQK